MPNRNARCVELVEKPGAPGFPAGAVSFVHIADLHLGNTCWPAVKKKGYPSSDEIKAICLGEVAAFIRDRKPDFVFVAGDLAEVHGNDPFGCDVMSCAKKLFSPVVKACKSSGTSIVAIPGEHDPEVAVLREYFPSVSVLDVGEIDSFRGYRIGGLGARPLQKGIAKDFDRWQDKKLEFVLVHSEKIATSRFSRLGARYVARGHLHAWRDQSSLSLKSVHPGHLYTYWDGSGKAYPTCFAEGVVTDRECTVKRHVFRNAPRSRRFFWDATTSRFLLEGVLGEEREASFHGWQKSCDSFWFTISKKGKRRDMEEELRRVVSLYPKDVFVTPRSKAGKLVRYARDILNDADLFEQFARCSVREPGRQ